MHNYLRINSDTIAVGKYHIAKFVALYQFDTLKLSSTKSVCVRVGFWVVMCVTCSVLPSVRGSDATCTQHKNVIIGKNFIKKSNAANADACCSACFAYGYACKAFTYQISTKYCACVSCRCSTILALILMGRLIYWLINWLFYWRVG